MFRAGVDLVQVDVVVLDASGEPVHGLTKGDFTLIDKGTKQPVATFSELVHSRPPEKMFPVGLPLDVASNQTAKSDRLVMLVLDDLHFRSRTPEVLGLVRQVVNELEGGASIGLVTTSGTFGVEITEDRERLLLELGRFFDRYDPHIAETPNTPVVNAIGDVMRDPGPKDPPSFFSQFHAYRTVEDVARMMGANDGRRKAMVWISGGVEGANMAEVALHTPKVGVDPCFPSDGDWQTLAQQCDAIAGMFEKLRKSSVTVYPVNPGGPADKGQSLNQIAIESGGFAVRSTDLEAGMARLLTDLDNYYLLGFYPPDPKDKHYRPIEVSVDRPGVTVRYRRGYQPGGPPPPPKNDSALARLAAPVTPTTDLPLRVGAIRFFGTGGKAQMLVTLEVGVDAALPDVGASAVDSVEYAVYAVDLKKKSVGVTDSRRVDVQWPVDSGRAAGTFRVESVLALAAGSYQLRAAARSKTLDKSGSVYLQIDVPDDQEASLAVGGVALGLDRRESEQPAVMHAATLQGLTLPFRPSLTRAFNDSDDVRVFFEIRRSSSAVSITGTVAIVAEDGSEPVSDPWEVAAGAPPSVELRVPMAGIQAGPYKLVVTASDGRHQATREVAIRVD